MIIKKRLRFGWYKRSIGFNFCQFAWFTAFDVLNVAPSKFDEMPLERRIMAVKYGAAVKYCVDKKKRVFFTLEALQKALQKASKADNDEIDQALITADYPHWYESDEEEGDEPVKKK